ncbi:MAG: type II toxin-antitoxin system VapB family antitoxin [Geminicoccaceae bacterium]
MRTNIDLDDDLLEEARRLSGLRTKKAVVDKALATFIRCAREREALAMFGQLDWVGDLEAGREGRLRDSAPEPAAPEPARS